MKEINNNIEEPICSFEVSKLLKEKGFDVPTSDYYELTDESLVRARDVKSEGWVYRNSQFSSSQNRISAPTQSIALEWIRVNFGIHIIVEAQFDENETENGYFFMCYKTNKDKIKYQLDYISGKLIPEIYNTPQKAIEAGLLYALTKLIP